MPAVRGRTVSTIGGFLTPISIDGGQPRRGGVLTARGVFTITRTGRGIDGLPTRAGRGIFTVTKTGRGGPI